MWIDFLAKENLLAEGIMTVAYSYIGPELTYGLYKDGTIGKAKIHLKAKKSVEHPISFLLYCRTIQKCENRITVLIY